MIPIIGALTARKPRASGDDPGTRRARSWLAKVNPARAGMIPSPTSSMRIAAR